MIKRLDLQPGLRVLEPCAGDGAFVGPVLEIEPTSQLDAYDINPTAIGALRDKYGAMENVRILRSDVLTDAGLMLHSNAGGFYHRIIGNPPYGGWQEYDHRKVLKGIYEGLYVKETYALFLFRCLHLLEDGGVLSFIVPDTFLSLHMHTALRQVLLEQAKLDEIAIFPSRFFPGVSFGYSKLCIITLRRCDNRRACLDNRFKVLTGFSSPEELLDGGTAIKAHVLRQGEILENVGHALLLHENPRIADLINDCEYHLGDVADCVTGLYTGNDKTFLRASSGSSGERRGYEIVPDDCIWRGPGIPALTGLAADRHFVPIVKGGAAQYWKPDAWYVDWSIEAVRQFHENKKARFQNPQFYFRDGIALPMVSSKRVTAWLMEGKVFDQSVVGVFPKQEHSHLLFYLLAFLNSDACTALLRTINPSANNSANYVKKLPLIIPSKKVLATIEEKVRVILAASRTGKAMVTEIEHLNNCICDLYGV